MSLQEPEEIAHFTPELDSVIHSFSATETHAIFFFYPFIPNVAEMWAHNFHAFEVRSLIWKSLSVTGT